MNGIAVCARVRTGRESGSAQIAADAVYGGAGQGLADGYKMSEHVNLFVFPCIWIREAPWVPALDMAFLVVAAPENGSAMSVVTPSQASSSIEDK